MAERRMFAKSIIDSDAFLDMPPSAQSLYFHLSMRADDDGFVNKPKGVMRLAGSNNKDLEILIEKKFIIFFKDDGIVVIKHWKLANTIQGDRYKETNYKEIKETLCFDKNGAYTESKNEVETECEQVVNEVETECEQVVNEVETECEQVVNEVETQVRLGKISIGEERKEKEKEKEIFSLSQNLNPNSQTFETNFAKLQNTWNELKVGPPYKWLQTNIPPPEFSDIKRFLTNETDSVKIGIAAMRNYCAVLNAPDKFDPGGHKGYSFVSFLTKGFQHYRDEAEPVVKFKIKRSGFSPHLNLDGKKSLGAIANE